MAGVEIEEAVEGDVEERHSIQTDTDEQCEHTDVPQGNEGHVQTSFLPEVVQTPTNIRFTGSGMWDDKAMSTVTVADLSGSTDTEQAHLYLDKQVSEITQAVSISAILRDVEYDSVSQSVDVERHTPDADHTDKSPDADPTDDDILVQPARSPVLEHCGLEFPSITPREVPKGKRFVRKRISNSPPKHYREFRNLLYTKTRQTKLFTRATKYALLKSEANYIRMCKIIVTLGPMILRVVFRAYMDRIYPPKDLRQFLEHYRRRLISFSSTERILNLRWKSLFPDDNQEIHLQQLDPAIIFWFIRHICHFKKQIDLVWKWKPAVNDVSVAADVARIRDLRNGLISSTEHALYEDEFERKLEEIKMVTLRLCGEKQATEMLQLIKEIRTESVKIPEKDQNLDILTKWAEETKDLHIEKIAPCRQDWETVTQCKVMTCRFLKRFRRPRVFVKTKIYKTASEKLARNGFVILKGNTGEGKTTTALALMAALYEEDETLVMSSTEHWKYINKHTVGAILIDDILGSMHFDEKQLTEWEVHFDEIYRGCTGRNSRSEACRHCDACAEKKDRPVSKVIITVRKHVFDQCVKTLSKYKLFADDNVVDCSSKELVVAEKRLMLSRHIIADHRVKSEVDKSARLTISKLGFPQTCALFVSQEVFLDQGSQFFEKPVDMLQRHLDDLYRIDMYGYLALVVMMFQPGAVLFLKKLEEFTDETFKKQFLDMAAVCEIPMSDHLPSFCLMALVNTAKPYVYYYDDIACFTFIHESVMEIMMSTFVTKHPQHVLETCAFQFIKHYVATDENLEVPRDQLFLMKIDKHNFWLLSQLFDHYMSYGYVVKVAQHRAFRDPKFLKFFVEYIKKKELKEELILRVDNGIKGDEEDRHIGFLYGAVDQDNPNVELAIAILQLGYHVRKAVNPEWCLSELRSTMCAAVKRGNFAIYSALAATKIDLPDKLLADKKYLTSLDIVTDILRRRHWSKEQKDIVLVLASRRTTPASTDIVSLMLQRGASVSSIRCGTTALCEAVKSGNGTTVSLLLESGASVYDRDLNDQTPLHHACEWNRVETVKLLLQKGADINTRDTSGMSPFLVAAGWGREDIIEMLLSKRADPFTIDEQENTILHICAANGRTDVMRKIIKNFPWDILSILIARNRYGWTPLDFAMKCGHLGVTKLLVRTILQNDAQKPGHRSFVHSRFNVVKLESLNKEEACLHRFVDLDSENVCFQVPRGKWYVQAGNTDDYDKVTHFVSRYEDRLKVRFAKS